MREAFVSMRFDEQTLRDIERRVAGIPGAMNRIIPPSLNRTASWAKTRMKREIASQMGSKIKDAGSVLDIDHANAAKWNSQVLIYKARMPLMLFATGRTAEGVAYQLPRRGAGVWKHAFFATMSTGHRGVFRRRLKCFRRTEGRPSTSSPNLPIHEQYIYLNRALDMTFLPGVVRAAGQQLLKEVASRIRWQLQRRR